MGINKVSASILALFKAVTDRPQGIMLTA